MTSILARICTEKREEIGRRLRHRSPADVLAAARLASPPRGFAAALRHATATGGYGLIAELKKASPSKGLIRADFDPPSLAQAYAEGGAACLSVLTDRPFFQGDDLYLSQARAAVTLPVLRKEFFLDPYQVVESRAIGADAILVILAVVDDALALDLHQAASALGMDVLVEVHDRAELDRALTLGPGLIGINNRDLNTFTVDLATTEALAPLVPPDRLVVSESGLSRPGDLARLAHVGVRCFLVGEALVTQADVAAATRALLATAPTLAGV